MILKKNNKISSDNLIALRPRLKGISPSYLQNLFK